MLIYFSLTLFVSAALMFLVQPMIGKMILPQLGGTPAVWNTCMVFFQGMLLIGYGYTHLLTTTQPTRRQVIIQSIVLFLPFLVLPFAVGDWTPPTDRNPIFSLLGKLALMVGLPFFAVSTTAPLLQKWFVHTGHPAAKDPYFLYGASNLGSMLGLALYPLVVEPWLPVTAATEEATFETQVHLWAAGFALFVAMVFVCAILTWRQDSDLADSNERQDFNLAATEKIGIARRLRWIGLAAVPSSLMLGVTTYMTTDIAAIAFFWILPLALYLLTFILVFARWPVAWTGTPHQIILYVQPIFLLALVFKMISRVALPMWLEFSLHLMAFFTTTLMCHGELARDRPSTKHLTEFYFWMSLGGVLGGLFNALFAPIVFQYGIWEYPIAMVAACLLRANLVTKPMIPDDSSPAAPTRMGRMLDLAVPVMLACIAMMLFYAGTNELLNRSLLLGIPVIAALTLLWRPVRLGLGVAALFIGIIAIERRHEPMIFEARGFFGPVRVQSVDAIGARPKVAADQERKIYRVLVHGGINHGAQVYAVMDKDGKLSAAQAHRERRKTITYFHERNGVAEVYQKLSWPDARLPASMFGLACGGNVPWTMLANTQSEPPVAVIGLGSGILACYAKPYQRMDFFEIDPLVKNLCVTPGYAPPWERAANAPPAPEPTFTFLHDAQERGARTDVILGDGRLKLHDAPDKYYHIISLDAFSSDAIPVHLLTAEAIELYMSKLADGGVLVFNATNAYVRIQGVVAAIAKAKGYDVLQCADRRTDDDPAERFSADWVVLQRKPVAHAWTNGGPPIRVRLQKERPRLGIDGQIVRDKAGAEVIEVRWRDVEPNPGPIWTDRYSNLLDPHVMPGLKFWR